MSNSKTFRLFLSSTFNDMRAERDKLQAEVFPELRRYCEERGFSFQPIDLRWGVSSEAGNDQKTMQICIDEVKRCKNALTPHFAIMLGERYGWIPLPAAVEANEFEQVKKAITAKYPSDSKEVRYLNEWYKKDNNAIPAEYKLQPKRTEVNWSDVENTLREAFRSVVNHELNEKLTDEQKFKYIKSATEQEIIEGLFHNQTAKENIYFYNRKFENIEKLTAKEFATLEASDKKADYSITVKHFSDFKNDQLDTAIRADHLELINKIKTELPLKSVKSYPLKLDSSLERTQDSVTKAYLQEFANDFKKAIRAAIEKEIKRFKKQEVVNPQERELAEQQNFLNEKAKIFVGREAFIQQIGTYLCAKESNAPLVITADSGSGKSALMAKMIQKTLGKNAPNTKILYRFVGTTENSNNPINLHQSLYNQLMGDEALQTLRDNYLAENGLQLEQVQSDFKDLSKLLAHLLGNYPETQKLNLFIDALDQFILTDPLDWLPRTLSKNIKIILSTLPDDSYQEIKYLPKLKQKYLQEGNYLYLEKFQATEASLMIDEYLQNQQRTITSTQKQKLLDAFSQSGSPLYLKILLEEARDWHSYTNVDNEIYPAELEALITRFFNRLHSHSHHSQPLIDYAFAYLACSKDGLAEPELFDILSQEQAVMRDRDIVNDFYPKPTRLPTAVWARLYSEMASYLTTKKIDGIDQIAFFHRKFNEGAYQLLGSREIAHTNLAHFYEAVYKNPSDFDTSIKSVLTEFPYQLIMSNQKEKALQLLTNFEFLMKKFKLNKTQEIVEDYALAKAMGMNSGEEINEEFKERFYIFDNFISSNKHILERGDEEWDSSKIFFQLSIEHADNSPLTQAAEKYEREGKVDFKYIRDTNRPIDIYISPLVKVIDWHDHRYLGAIELKNGNILTYSALGKIVICDPDGVITNAFNVTQDTISGVFELDNGWIATWSGKKYSYVFDDIEVKTNNIYIFDIYGALQLTLQGHEKPVLGLIELKNKTIFSIENGYLSSELILTWSEDKTIRIWNLKGEQVNELFIKHKYEISKVIEHDLFLISLGQESLSANGEMIIWYPVKDKKIAAYFSNENSNAYKWHNLNITAINKDILLWSLHDGIVKYSPRNIIAMVSKYGAESQNLYFRENETALYFHKHIVNYVTQFSTNKILSCSRDKKLILFDLDNNEKICEMKQHTESVTGALELSNGDIVSWSDDATLVLLDKQGNYKKTLSGHLGSVIGAKEIKNNKIISWSKDKTLRLWNSNGEYLGILGEHQEAVRGIVVLKNGNILSWGYWNDPKIWNPNNAKYIKNNCNIGSIPTTPTKNIFIGKTKVMTTDFNEITVWSKRSRSNIIFNGHTDEVLGVIEAQKQKNKIISWGRDCTIRIWDATNGECLHTLKGHKDDVTCVVEDYVGRLVSCSRDQRIVRWNNIPSEGWKPVKAYFEYSSDYIRGIIDSSLGFIYWFDYEIKHFDFDEEAKTLKKFDGKIIDVILEESWLAVYTNEKSVYIYNSDNWVEFSTLKEAKVQYDFVKQFERQDLTLTSPIQCDELKWYPQNIYCSNLGKVEYTTAVKDGNRIRFLEAIELVNQN